MATLRDLLSNLIDLSLEQSEVCLSGKPRIVTPVRFMGGGFVSVGERVHFGTIKGPSPLQLSQIVTINGGQVIIEDDVTINNNFYILADGSTIKISSNTVIGANFQAMTINGHGLKFENRMRRDKAAAISIGKGVWIGSNVTILKGATIGDYCVVGAGLKIPSHFKSLDSRIIDFDSTAIKVKPIDNFGPN